MDIMSNYFVYMATCADGTIYTGYTKNLIERIEKHNAGHGARYTKLHRPIRLSYTEIFSSQKEAMKRERELKKLSRGEKLLLINNFKGIINNQ